MFIEMITKTTEWLKWERERNISIFTSVCISRREKKKELDRVMDTLFSYLEVTERRGAGDTTGKE